MKKLTIGILLAMAMLYGISAANAEPERFQLKDPAKKAKEQAAASRIKTLDTRDIEDPAAQKAIQEIINYLGLKTKN